MRFAHWISKAAETHSECVILIAIQLQQWLQERASLLRYTYNTCLACIHGREGVFIHVQSIVASCM